MKRKQYIYSEPYVYNALVTNVLKDGGIYLDIDLGFSIIKKDVRVDLLNIEMPQTPEASLISSDVLREKILNKIVVVQLVRNYAIIWLNYVIVEEDRGEGGFENINDWMVDNNYAIYNES